jgi:hypothetical protein
MGAKSSPLLHMVGTAASFRLVCARIPGSSVVADSCTFLVRVGRPALITGPILAEAAAGRDSRC